MSKIVECKECKSMFLVLTDGGVKMDEVVANTVDAAKEKHVPVYSVNDNVCTVTVGDVLHPMTEAHLINWVLVETNKAKHIVELSANSNPTCEVALTEGEVVVKVYAYCNLHGLWSK